MLKIYLSLANSMSIFVLLILSASSVILGDYFAKLFSTTQKDLFFILSIIGYIGSGLFFIPTLLRENLVIVSIIWEIMAISGMLFIGFVLFGEKVNIYQMIGLFFALIGIIILIVSDNIK